MTIRKDLYDRRVLEVPTGQIIFSEGDDGAETYVIISGAVEISKRTSLSTSKTLIMLKPGDIFGEMAIIEQKPRSATAIAVRPSRLLSLDESLFFQMIEKNPYFAVKVVKLLSERIRRANLSIQQLSSANRETRIIQGIKDFAADTGKSGLYGITIDKARFVDWACAHIGMGDWDLNEGLDTLVKKKYLAVGSNPKELLIERELPKAEI
jgi:CRP/FNR family transcriptional regulator, cyclic AMP receptor protein